MKIKPSLGSAGDVGHIWTFLLPSPSTSYIISYLANTLPTNVIRDRDLRQAGRHLAGAKKRKKKLGSARKEA